ncbi:hypothetical protein ABVK25_009696 [Lepraria finkii]|uniref:Uncharacterized protein n=1 Tax=Lepraria finkii TaxID=1340010 RepID=A0ABR4AZG8_9LECA
MEGSRKGSPGGAKLDAELGTTLCPRLLLQSLACCPLRLPCSQPDTALRYLHSPSFACVFPSSRLAPRSLYRPTYSSRCLQCRRRSPQRISSSEPARRDLISTRGSLIGLKSRSTSNRRPKRITRGLWVYRRDTHRSTPALTPILRQRRHYPTIPPATTLSVTNFIKDPLRKELGLAHRKSIRSYGTTNHFIHLGTQLWEKDWQIYDKPRVRVDTWAKIQLYVFTSARVGEYIESTCRAGSGRGLYYRDMTFGVFRNEHGKAEFAIQVVRDAKNMTWTPEKRPEHSVHEGLEPRPLFCNPVLTMLARAIADNAFRDYSTMEELFDIEPPEDKMYHLRQRDGVLDKPFFHVLSTGEMEKADTFSRRLRELGIRAGYLRPPTIHDFRAEGLYLVGIFPLSSLST